MKKKEKEHLKTDPFIRFFETAFAFIKSHRRWIVMGAAAVALVVLALMLLLLFRNLSSSGENTLYAEAFRVRNDGKMTLDQKIAALQKMKFKRGISASGRLFLAALHYEKGELAKAEALLTAMPASRLRLLNDEKHALYAQVLAAGGKSAEAEAVLNRLLAEKKTVLSRELILIQLAKLQRKDRRYAEAAATLQRVIAEHPDTPGAMEAQSLLSTIANPAPTAP
jgi:tetratricopeptide (TPR) repeat protein